MRSLPRGSSATGSDCLVSKATAEEAKRLSLRPRAMAQMASPRLETAHWLKKWVEEKKL